MRISCYVFFSVSPRLLGFSMEDPTPPLDTPGIDGWDLVSKPGQV